MRKFIGLITGVVMILAASTGFADPRLDASTQEALKASQAEIAEPMTDEQRLKFRDAMLFYMAGQKTGFEALAVFGNKDQVLKNAQVIDGMTGDEITKLFDAALAEKAN